MRLAKFTQVNRDHFKKGSGYPKKKWISLIECGAISGKILCDDVLIDVDDFLSRDVFLPNNSLSEEMDLLNG